MFSSCRVPAQVNPTMHIIAQSALKTDAEIQFIEIVTGAEEGQRRGCSTSPDPGVQRRPMVVGYAHIPIWSLMYVFTLFIEHIHGPERKPL